MQVVTIIGLAFALLVAVFAIQNSAPVTVTFLRWHLVDVSLALVILGSAAAGAVVVGLLGAVREIGLRLSVRSFRGKAERLGQELETARERAVSVEDELARLKSEVHAKARELEAARQRVEALEVELEATRSMEILPRPQDETDVEAGAGARIGTGTGTGNRTGAGTGEGAVAGAGDGVTPDPASETGGCPKGSGNGNGSGNETRRHDRRDNGYRSGWEGDGTV
ncbi:MAG: lipopolysaccharide assembly protein LapA domain-containing protein [Bacillota bacterium]|nr:lipopolysaccharide assembly protein LapA domain-containing protein [Bacillota bacterium]